MRRLVLAPRKWSSGGWQKGLPKKSELPLHWTNAIKVQFQVILLMTWKKLVR